MSKDILYINAKAEFSKELGHAREEILHNVWSVLFQFSDEEFGPVRRVSDLRSSLRAKGFTLVSLGHNDSAPLKENS